MATMTQTQTFSYSPLSVPPSADPAAFKDFGRKVEGFNPDTIDERGMSEIIDMLYKVSPRLGHVKSRGNWLTGS